MSSVSLVPRPSACSPLTRPPPAPPPPPSRPRTSTPTSRWTSRCVSFCFPWDLAELLSLFFFETFPLRDPTGFSGAVDRHHVDVSTDPERNLMPIRIQIQRFGSGFGYNQVRSVDPDLGGQKWPTKIEKKHCGISCFQCWIIVIFWGLKASPVAWTYLWRPRDK